MRSTGGKETQRREVEGKAAEGAGDEKRVVWVKRVAKRSSARNMS